MGTAARSASAALPVCGLPPKCSLTKRAFSKAATSSGVASGARVGNRISSTQCSYLVSSRINLHQLLTIIPCYKTFVLLLKSTSADKVFGYKGTFLATIRINLSNFIFVHLTQITT